MLLLISERANAQVVNGPASHVIKLGLGANFAYGSSSASGDTSSTTVGAFDLNANLGAVLYGRYVVGARGDYRILTQYSPYDPNVGNRRGTFVSVFSPFVGVFINSIFLGVTYVCGGEYLLTNPTVSGATVKFVSPSGYRVDLEWETESLLKPTIYYESVSFSGLNSASNSIAIPGPLVLTTYGIGVTLTY